MKMFVVKGVILALVLVGILVLFIRAPWLAREPFQNIKKKHAILGSISGKKVILVGGSGVANGLSAGVIQAHLPGYEAVNMGLNAGLGVEFNLREIMEAIKPGDIILLSPEYDNFEGGCRGSVQLLKAINVAPFAARYLDGERYQELLRNDVLTFLQLKAQSYLDGFAGMMTGIGEVAIDGKGDRISRSALRDVGSLEFSFRLLPQPYGECAKILRRFHEQCKEKGAVAVLSFPALPAPQYERARREIELLSEKLQMDTGMLILHPPAATVYESGLFDDTVYHLGRQGRELRSLMIARLLKEKVLHRGEGRQ